MEPSPARACPEPRIKACPVLDTGSRAGFDSGTPLEPGASSGRGLPLTKTTLVWSTTITFPASLEVSPAPSWPKTWAIAQRQAIALFLQSLPRILACLKMGHLIYADYGYSPHNR